MSQTPLENERFSRAGGAVAAFFAAAPFAAMGGALVLAPLGGLAGLIAAPWTRMHRAAATGGLPLVLGGAFLAWTAASVLWSPAPSWQDAAMLVGAVLTLGCLVLAADAARVADQALVRRAALTGLGALMALLAVEALFDFPISRQLVSPKNDVVIERTAAPMASADQLPGAPLTASSPLVSDEPTLDAPPTMRTHISNSAVFSSDAAKAVALVIVCVWGAAALLAPFSWPGWIGMFVLLAGSAWLSLQFNTISNFVALSAGFVAAILALRWPRATVSIAGQVIAAWVVIAPMLLPQLALLTAQAIKLFFNYDVPFSWLARVETWSFTAQRIREQLFLGWGFQASDSFDQTTNLLGFTLQLIPRHPHNVPMQIWLETGAVGAALAAAALGAFGRRAGAALAQDRWAAAATAGALVSAAVIANVSFGAWALWWWASLAAAAALVRASRKIT